MALPVESFGEPTWGERFHLARRRSKLTLDEAAQRIVVVLSTSYGALNRLEARDEEPTDRRQRTVAFVALLAYGVNPEDFGLTRSDLPAAVDEDKLRVLLASHTVDRASRVKLEIAGRPGTPWRRRPMSGASNDDLAEAA